VPVYLLKYWRRVPALLREQRSFTVEENLGMLNYLSAMREMPQTLRRLFPTAQPARFDFHLLEHHYCHAASAFYPTEFEDAAILTVDGAGEWSTAMLAHGRGNDIRRLAAVNTPHSLGAFYQAVARHLGFALIEGPGKLMGLASYGDRAAAVYHRMRELVRLKPDGGFALDMSYFSYHYTRKSGVSQKFTRAFGQSKQEQGDWSQHELNVAAAAQRIVEDVVLHMVRTLKQKTRSANLCMAGGVALNSVANGLIAREGLFDHIFVQPAAGDSGTALGAALLLNHRDLRRPRKWVMRTAFLGPAYTTDDYRRAIARHDLPYAQTSAVSQFAARALARDRILAWFQGRLEYGPRALGNRSIITSPLSPGMKDTLNRRVKFRESFRPFAAMVLEEDCARYFDDARPNPYMLFVYRVRPEFVARLPAVTHVDGSVRIQTVGREDNPEIRRLLEAFRDETGYAVLLNTSFNVRSEPIVATPDDALDSFVRADIDYLVMGDFVIAKPHDHAALAGL
jgi:carbamoyltransferase